MADIIKQFMYIASNTVYSDWKLTQYSEEIVVETYCEIYEDDKEVYDFVKHNAELQDNIQIDDHGNSMFLTVRIQMDEKMTLLQMRKRVQDFLLAEAMGWKKPTPAKKKIQLTLKVHPSIC